MSNTQRGIAKYNQSSTIARIDGAEGPQLLNITVLDAPSVLLNISKEFGGVETGLVKTGSETSYAAEALIATADGSDKTFAPTTAHAPVVPGSFNLRSTAGSPALLDENKDGILYAQNATARKIAASGTFATMAGETMVVKVSGVPAFENVLQTVTFGTESTIAAATALINAQTGGLLAVAQGAQNVDLRSDSTGTKAAIEVVSCSPGVTTKLGISPGKATTVAGSIKYGTGVCDIAYPGDYAPSGSSASAARVVASNTGPWNLSPGDTLIGDVDYAVSPSNQTATFNATAPTATGSAGSFAALAGEAFTVTVTGYDPVVITMATEATQILAIAKINLLLKGAHCETVDAGNVRIIGDKLGTGQQIILSSVAAGITTKLGLAAGTSTGTGNVANIDAVTFEEVKAIVEAAWTHGSGCTVSAVGNSFVIESDTTGVGSKIKVDASSTAETIFGLSTTASIGSATGGAGTVLADYKSASALAGLSNNAVRIPNLQQGETLVVKALGVTGASRVSVDVIPQR